MSKKNFKFKHNYTGLVLGFCPKCRKISVYVSATEESKGLMCRHCGEHETYNTPPRGVTAVCECGNKILGVTNCTEDVFEFECKCGYIIPVEFNKKRNIYYSMR